MADLKISQLTAASTPLAGTEVLPIVQSSTTKKVATDDLTVKNIRSNASTGILQVAGPAAAATRVMTTPDANFTVARTDAANSFTGDQTLSTGNLIVGTAGNGIDFSAASHAAGMTSELFDDYEEGTWTPTLATDNVNFTSVSYASNVGGLYTKIGRFVFIQGFMSTTAVTVGSASGTVAIGGLPFNVVANSTGLVDAYGGATVGRSDSWTTNNPSAGVCVPGTNLLYLYYRTAANGGTTLMPVSSVATGSGNNMFFTGLYVTAT